MRDAFLLLLVERIDEREIFVSTVIWPEIIRTVVPLLADLVLRHELNDFDVARRRWRELLEIFFSENDKLPWLDFVAFLNLFVGHFFAGIRLDHVLLHTRFVFVVEDVEAHGLVLDR